MGAGNDIGAFELCRDLPTFEVTTRLDGMVGSLCAAIECSAPGGTITFAPSMPDTFIPGHPAGILFLVGGELVIDKDLTIEGPGANRLSLQVTNGRCFRVASGRVRISGLSLSGIARGTNGNDAANATESGGPGTDAEGGGILNHGDLTLTDLMVSNCKALSGYGGAGGTSFGILDPGAGGAGGVARGAGICNRGILRLLRCTIANNAGYGGIGGLGGQDNSVNPGNSGGMGGAGGFATGGGIYNAGMLSATNCTVVTNKVFAGNGGIGGFGIPVGGRGGAGGTGYGAGWSDDATGAVVSCTFHANMASLGLGGVGGAGNTTPGSRGTDGVTAAGGLYDGPGGTPLFVRNTIVAGNVADLGSDVGGEFQSGGFNLVGIIGDGALVPGFNQPTDILGSSPTHIDAHFGPLDYFGGSTPVQSLQANSPALDKGHASGTATDQRGLPRPQDQPSIANAPGGDGSDMGAYESE